MNERIKQLAEQAGYLPDNFGVGHWDMPECQMFAELIIRECANIAKDVRIFYNEYDHNEINRVICTDIKQHFGVEE